MQAKIVPATQELELYYFHDSCCCQKVKLALEEVGLAAACRQEHLDIGRYGRYDHLRDVALKRNPMATVPVLVHMGHPILDATSQIRYVEQVLDGNASLVPSTPNEKAIMDKIIEECDIDLRPKALTNIANSWGNAVQLFSLQRISYSHKYYSLRKCLYALSKHPNPLIPLNRIMYNVLRIQIEPSASQEALERIDRAILEYDALLADGRSYLCGDTYTLADVACLPLLHRLNELGMLGHFLSPEHDGSERKFVLAYWKRLRERASSKKVFNEWEPKTRIQKAICTAFKRRRKLVEAVGVDAALKS